MKKSFLSTIIVGFIFSNLALAQAKPGAPPPKPGTPPPSNMQGPSKEERAKMAENYIAMAKCLKTDKPINECFKAMAMSQRGAHPMMGGGPGPGPLRPMGPPGGTPPPPMSITPSAPKPAK
jgi:hypothetical protein